MTDEFMLNLLYRRVYTSARDRMDREPLTLDREPIHRRIRATPLEDVGPLDPPLAEDPQVLEVIRDAVEDALAGRRPCW
jgi:hypothetical protein